MLDVELPEDLPELAEWTSARERDAAEIEYLADELCLAWLLERRLFEEGWEATFEGEIVGAIGSGLFVRFDGVFEGYLPARRLPGDYFELTPLGTALVGRRSGSALPPRRPDRGQGRGAQALGGQGRARARVTVEIICRTLRRKVSVPTCAGDGSL